MTERVNLLNEAEQHALEKGARQRAKALAALEEMATVFGMSGDVVATMAAGIRRLGKGDAREAWRTIGDMNEIADYLRHIAERVEVVDDSTGPNEEILQHDELVVETELAANVETQADDEEDSIRVSFREARSFYKTICSKTKGSYLSVPEMPDDIDVDELMALLELYGRTHHYKKQTSTKIDILLLSLQHKAAVAANLHGGYNEKQVWSTRHNAALAIAKRLDELHGYADTKDTTQADKLHNASRSELTSLFPESTSEVLALPDEVHYKSEQVQRFLVQLRKQGIGMEGVDELSFDDTVFLQLANAYAKHTQLSEEMCVANIATTWGWLVGARPADLADLQAAVRSREARMTDVPNARGSFVTGVKSAVNSGWNIFVRPAEAKSENNSGLVEVATVAAEEAATIVAHETKEVVLSQEFVGAAERRSKIIHGFEVRFSSDVNHAAFDGILDQANRGEMTPAKRIVFEQLRNVIGQVSPDGSVFERLDIDNEAKAVLRRFTGLGFTKNGQPVEHEPCALRDMFSGNTPKAEKDALASKLYDGLEALLAELGSTEVEPVKTVKVVEANGVPQLEW